jgi:cytochrome c oxidase accessory protein FixG
MSAEESKSEQSAVRTPQSKMRGGRYAPSLENVTTIREDGSRRDIHPADVQGRFTVNRRLAAWILIAVYLLLPWIPVNGAPAVFLDVAERRFHFFGFTLAAQDVWLLFFGVSGLGFALFFLTALFGRLWCGWACPQTVFLEHVFRRIERWIDGDATQRRALAAAPASPGKLVRGVAKHTIYAIVALLITHLFLAYFVSLPRLWSFMHEAPGENWAAFVFVFAAAGVLYFNFAWFREQLCIVICPYGRLQSALTDDHSLVIGYDSRRGEPRGKISRGDRRPEAGDRQTAEIAAVAESSIQSPASRLLSPGHAGDCVDCNRCVQVCPTGIDIRHGLQLECIGCAACIDACDEVMTRVERPRGLIRYDSLAGLSGGKTRWIRTRTVVYFVLLLVGAAVATFAFSTVKPASFLVYRMTGAAYFVDKADVRNQYLVRLVNKRSEPATFLVHANGLPAGVTQSGFTAPITVPPQVEQVNPLVIVVNRRDYTGPFSFTVTVQDEAKTYQLERTVEFLGPDAKLLEEEDRENGIKR